jgi:hypothetical protein
MKYIFVPYIFNVWILILFVINLVKLQAAWGKNFSLQCASVSTSRLHATLNYYSLRRKLFVTIDSWSRYFDHSSYSKNSTNMQNDKLHFKHLWWWSQSNKTNDICQICANEYHIKVESCEKIRIEARVVKEDVTHVINEYFNVTDL